MELVPVWSILEQLPTIENQEWVILWVKVWIEEKADCSSKRVTIQPIL